MCFIELTIPNSGKKIQVNLDVALEMRADERSCKHTLIFFGPHDSVLVCESEAEIRRLGYEEMDRQRVFMAGQRALEVA